MRREWVGGARRGFVWGIVVSLHAGMLLMLIRPGTWQSRTRDEDAGRPIQVRFFAAPAPLPHRSDSPRRPRTIARFETPATYRPGQQPAKPIESELSPTPDRDIPDFRTPLLDEPGTRTSLPRIPGRATPIIAGFRFEPIPPSFARHLAELIGGMVSCGNIAVTRNMTPYERATRGITDQQLDRAADALGCH
jgi:hypothetical protein